MYSYPTGRTFFQHMNRASFLLQYQELKKTIEKTRFFWSKKLWQSCRKLQAPPFSQRSKTKGEGESKGICGSVGIGRGSKGSTPIPEKRGADEHAQGEGNLSPSMIGKEDFPHANAGSLNFFVVPIHRTSLGTMQYIIIKK